MFPLCSEVAVGRPGGAVRPLEEIREAIDAHEYEKFRKEFIDRLHSEE